MIIKIIKKKHESTEEGYFPEIDFTQEFKKDESGLFIPKEIKSKEQKNKIGFE